MIIQLPIVSPPQSNLLTAVLRRRAFSKAEQTFQVDRPSKPTGRLAMPSMSQHYVQDLSFCIEMGDAESQSSFDIVKSCYQPRSGLVMQNCRSKKRKKGTYGLANYCFIVCLVLNFFAKYEFL